MAAEKTRIFSSVKDVYQALSEGVKIEQQFSFSHPIKTNGKSKRLSLGRIWFNLLLPSKYPLVDYPVTAKDVTKILKELITEYTPEETSDFISIINQETFKMSSYIPTSFDIDALIIPENLKLEKEEFQKKNIKDPILFDKEATSIAKKIQKSVDERGYRMDNINQSGAKSIPFKQLMVAQGHVSDIESNILGPIKTAIADGNNPEDFYIAAAEARRGFYYKSAISSKPGYLARRVTMANANVILDNSIKDCKTNKTFDLRIDDNIAKIIKNRYYLNKSKIELITDPNSLIGQTIKLRSPLYCKSEKGICPICYGDSWKFLQTKNIGVLIGGDINNKALNAYMKMRHSSSVPQMIKVNFIKNLEKFNLLTDDLKKNFDISENTIIAKNNCYISFKRDDYNDNLIIESTDFFILPGIITIFLSEEPEKSWTMPFDFQVKLFKSSNYTEKGKTVTIEYNIGDKIMFQDMYQKTADVSILEQLLEGQAKYITSPEVLVLSLMEYLEGLDLNLIETVVQNMCRDTTDPIKPARLTNYESYNIYGQKKLPFLTSWINAMSFENVKKAIQYGLISGQDASDDPITKIVNEKYH